MKELPKLPNLEKPSLEQRLIFLDKMTNTYKINKTRAIEALCQSCGTRYNTVKKWFFRASSSSAADCPPSCWRNWKEDFGGDLNES